MNEDWFAQLLSGDTDLSAESYDSLSGALCKYPYFLLLLLNNLRFVKQVLPEQYAYLLKLYPLIMQRIENKQQLYVEKIIFLGEEFRMSLMDNIFDALKITSIKYNKEYMLEPKKTVVFFLPLIKEKNRNRYHICATCNKKECYMRNVNNLTYGYQQIYGGNGCVK